MTLELLERAIEDAPENATGYTVLGDWLAERGDPRGALIAAWQAGSGAFVTEMARHRDIFVHGLTGSDLTIEWRNGYIYGVGVEHDAFAPRPHPPLGERVDGLLARLQADGSWVRLAVGTHRPGHGWQRRRGDRCAGPRRRPARCVLSCSGPSRAGALTRTAARSRSCGRRSIGSPSCSPRSLLPRRCERAVAEAARAARPRLQVVPGRRARGGALAPARPPRHRHRAGPRGGDRRDPHARRPRQPRRAVAAWQAPPRCRDRRRAGIADAATVAQALARRVRAGRCRRGHAGRSCG